MRRRVRLHAPAVAAEGCRAVVNGAGSGVRAACEGSGYR
jgi:hypothetical protein